MKKFLWYLIFGVLLVVPYSCEEDEPVLLSCEEVTKDLSLNEYMVIGSHNSYRMTTTPAIMQFMKANRHLLPEGFDPGHWEYGHPDLPTQFNQYGIRSIELDVYRDPVGGLFYNRIGNALVEMDVASGEPKLLQPGLKVMHFPDLDYNTHYLTFKDALQAVKTWSDAHPDHLPISILVEAKEDAPSILLPGYNFTTTLPYLGNAVEEIETEIMDVFGADLNKILQPDEVRGSFPTLKQAVMYRNWPELEDMRGRVMFILMSSERVRERYVDGHPSLEGRLMFVFTADDTTDEAAFIKLDDPKLHYYRIRNYVQNGFMVRTQADADAVEARENNTYRMNRALASGAQIISTDFYRSSALFPNYLVAFPDGGSAYVNHVLYPNTDASCELNE